MSVRCIHCVYIVYREAHGLCKEQITMYKLEKQLATKKSELKPF